VVKVDSMKAFELRESLMIKVKLVAINIRCEREDQRNGISPEIQHSWGTIEQSQDTLDLGESWKAFPKLPQEEMAQSIRIAWCLQKMLDSIGKYWISPCYLGIHG
jgi:hypothetical protein